MTAEGRALFRNQPQLLAPRLVYVVSRSLVPAVATAGTPRSRGGTACTTDCPATHLYRIAIRGRDDDDRESPRTPGSPDTEHSSLAGAALGEGTIVPAVLHAQGKYTTGIRFHHDTEGPTIRQREYSLML